jgi:hypothetical protein
MINKAFYAKLNLFAIVYYDFTMVCVLFHFFKTTFKENKKCVVVSRCHVIDIMTFER